MIKIELLSKIPNDIIINNIIPYTYIKKCPKHLQDIRSFYSHFSLAENYYYIYYNEDILFNDLEEFFYKNDEIYSITNKYYKIFKRHIIFKYTQYINISNYIYEKFYNMKTPPNKKIKFIWGLLTPNERIAFLNKYVLE
jgi:hypothetical protein